MDKREIQELFKELNLPEEMLPEYKDPYVFAENIKKCSILKSSEVFFSIGTGCIKGKDNAELE